MSGRSQRIHPTSVRHEIFTAVRGISKRVGIDLLRYPSLQDPVVRRSRLLAAARIEVVIDVGANDGGYADSLRDGGYLGVIHSFEPLSDAFTILNERSARDPRWYVHHAALGAKSGALEINVAGNSTSSSFLPMLERHERAAPQSRTVRREIVEMTTLDDAMSQLAIADSRVFVKLDTQGYEDQVLAGGRETLSRVGGVQIELSLVELYEGQKLWLEMIDVLHRTGLTCVGLEPGFSDKRTGQMLQCDGIFIRSSVLR